jgi:hypothetical protein
MNNLKITFALIFCCAVLRGSCQYFEVTDLGWYMASDGIKGSIALTNKTDSTLNISRITSPEGIVFTPRGRLTPLPPQQSMVLNFVCIRMSRVFPYDTLNLCSYGTQSKREGNPLIMYIDFKDKKTIVKYLPTIETLILRYGADLPCHRKFVESAFDNQTDTILFSPELSGVRLIYSSEKNITMDGDLIFFNPTDKPFYINDILDYDRQFHLFLKGSIPNIETPLARRFFGYDYIVIRVTKARMTIAECLYLLKNGLSLKTKFTFKKGDLTFHTYVQVELPAKNITELNSSY